MSSSQDQGVVSLAAPTYAEIELWLRSTIAELLDVDSNEVDIRARFARFGIDSATALIITDMLSEWLALEFEPSLLYEHETIEQLARHLATRVAAPVQNGSD